MTWLEWKRFVFANKINVSILILVLIAAILHFVLKPSLMYNDDGSFRHFGVGYRHKTILPFWMVMHLVAIFAYTGVLAYVTLF